jgi:quinol monooxygenase YgiN
VFTAIATHYPHPDHAAELEGHMLLVRDTVRGAEGLIEFECFRSDDGARLLGISKWESRDAFEAALPLIMSHRDRRRDEWTVTEDELTELESF